MSSVVYQQACMRERDEALLLFFIDTKDDDDESKSTTAASKKKTNERKMSFGRVYTQASTGTSTIGQRSDNQLNPMIEKFD